MEWDMADGAVQGMSDTIPSASKFQTPVHALPEFLVPLSPECADHLYSVLFDGTGRPDAAAGPTGAATEQQGLNPGAPAGAPSVQGYVAAPAAGDPVIAFSSPDSILYSEDDGGLEDIPALARETTTVVPVESTTSAVRTRRSSRVRHAPDFDDDSDEPVVPSDSDDAYEQGRSRRSSAAAAASAGQRRRWRRPEQQALSAAVRKQCRQLLLQRAVASGQPTAAVPGADELSPEHVAAAIDDVDWEIVALDFAPTHTADDCRLQWAEQQQRHAAAAAALSHPMHLSDGEEGGAGRGKWTREEDRRLVEAIREYGDAHWKLVANHVGSRTAAQCLHRWKHSLKPSISRQKWTASEDERLMRAVQQHGRHWSLIAHVMGNRTGAQCRERFCNKLDPEIYRGQWTTDEDARLRAAVLQVGVGKWAQIAKMLHPPRTDYQIRKRWYIISRGDPALQQQQQQQQQSHAHYGVSSPVA